MSHLPRLASLQSSIVMLRGQGRFGTGFPVARQGKRTFLVTCQHVVDDLGGSDSIRVGESSVELVASGEEKEIDLAVLAVRGYGSLISLTLDPASQEGAPFELACYRYLPNGHFRTFVLVGSMNGPFVMADSAGVATGIQLWDLKVSRSGGFERGDSGSPVVNRATGGVMGVLVARKQAVGLAVSIKALAEIWPEMPSGLLDGDSSVSTAGAGAARDARPQRVATGTGRRPIEKVPTRLVDHVGRGEVVPVIGAGLSMSASVEGQDSVMPSYAELLEGLVQRAREIGIPESDLEVIEAALQDERYSKAVEEIRDVLGLSFDRELRSILNPVEAGIRPSPAHKLLRVLDFDQILTTNYDRLLEIFVAPRHEVVTAADAQFGDYLSEAVRGKFIFKIHGDITRPDTIYFGEDRLRELYEGEESLGRFLRDLARRKTFLFLGYSFEHASEGYVELLRKFLGGSPRSHYALVPHGTTSQGLRRDLRREANIHFIEYHPDDQHSQVWEFISFLNAKKREEPELGQRWARWYLPRDRDQYLLRQLNLETKAASAFYLTPGLTNALATDAYLEACVLPQYVARRGVVEAMRQRRDHLESRLLGGSLEVRCLFLKSELDLEMASGKALLLERYRHVLSLVEEPVVDLELRLIPDLDKESLKRREATFALIFGREPQPEVDVGLCYASQATSDLFQLHMIEINTETVEQRLFRFERYWAAAWNESETLDYLKQSLKGAERGTG